MLLGMRRLCRQNFWKNRFAKCKEQNASLIGKPWENRFSRSGIPTHLAE